MTAPLHDALQAQGYQPYCGRSCSSIALEAITSQQGLDAGRINRPMPETNGISGTEHFKLSAAGEVWHSGAPTTDSLPPSDGRRWRPTVDLSRTPC